MDGVFEGVLAESWKPSADFKTYTVKIRKGVKFHDGKDMTVDDVVYSVSEIWKKYAVASALTDFAGIESPDADTVVFKYNNPTPEFFFASTLCSPVAYIVPKHVYAGSDPVTNPANNAPIATGPWKFKEWVRGSHFEYVKNENYWKKDEPYLDRLIIRYVRDPAGRAAAMEAGDIHIGVFNPVAPPDIKRLTGTGKFVATPRATRKRSGRRRSNATCAIRSSPSARSGRPCSTPSIASSSQRRCTTAMRGRARARSTPPTRSSSPPTRSRPASIRRRRPPCSTRPASRRRRTASASP
jgi:ABC-type transport system substrate-binding protein